MPETRPPVAEDEQPPIAEAVAFVGQLAQPGAQLRVRRSAKMIADHLPARADDAAGPAFRQAHHGPQMRDGIALHRGPYHFLTEAPEARPHPASARPSSCPEKIGGLLNHDGAASPPP